jgi:hypothetical protein
MNYESRSVYHPLTGTGQSENRTFTSASSQSSALRPGIYAISADQTCYIRLGTNPTAVTTDFRLPSNTLLYIQVDANERIAVIRETTDGTLNICLQR